MTDHDTHLDGFEDWEGVGDQHLGDGGFEPIERPAWRRPLLVLVATLTAIALTIVPIYNVLQGRTVAENGLEVCGFDYCVVQEAMSEAGLDQTMSRLSNTFYDEVEARDFANRLTQHLGVSPVGLHVMDDLDGRIGAVYDPAERSISIERPARAWTVLHEVAHVVENGHGEDFRNVVVELTRWAEAASP